MAIFHKTLQYHEDTTEKRDISQEDIEFLKKLQLEMNTQDTTGTADPRFWVIKGSESVINNDDPDELCLQVDGSTVARGFGFKLCDRIRFEDPETGKKYL